MKCDFGHAEIMAHGLLVSFVRRNAKGRVEEPQLDIFLFFPAGPIITSHPFFSTYQLARVRNVTGLGE